MPRLSALASSFVLAGVAAAIAACAYILPASWRSFKADPDDAAPAITRALDSQNIPVASFDQPNKKIVTSWTQTSSGVSRSRERFVISWERDAKENVLTIYVRHEAQDQDSAEEGIPAWGTVYHEDKRELVLLDRIEKELAAVTEPPPMPSSKR